MRAFMIILWLIFMFLIFGCLGVNYFFARIIARKPWNLRIDRNYKPKISIVVPTYNEREIIKYKLKNLFKLEYPRHLMEIIFVDSGSTDSTVDFIKKFSDAHPYMNIKVIEENERKGKSAALNLALKSCTGEVIIVSDADCFWPSDILSRSLPYLADPTVGAISGPKKLLNPKDSWVTKCEDLYLQSVNLVKLSESKRSSTILFEGGFSAYKKEALTQFDPYNTGSDDCGTVIDILRRKYRAIMVPEAEFYTTFPKTLKEKLGIKIRRASQLLKLFKMYIKFLFKKEIGVGKAVVVKNLILYFVMPLAFFIFISSTVYLFFSYPYASFLLLLLLLPKVRMYVFEATINCVVLMMAIVVGIFGKNFIIWNQPRDRILLTEKMLVQRDLI